MLKLDEAVDRLSPLLQENRLIIFVGSGISIGSGLPSWDGFLEAFIAFCQETARTYKDPNIVSLLSSDLLRDAKAEAKHHPVRVATALKSKLEQIPERLRSNVNDEFKRWFYGLFIAAKPNDQHRSIVETSYPYILTSNYDLLLEDAAKASGFALPSWSFTQKERIAEEIYTRTPAIVHVHGKFTDILLKQVVFTSEDYVRIIKKGMPGFSFALQSLFLSYSTLFVGYGASDPHLEDLIEELAYFFDFPGEANRLSQNYLVVNEGRVSRVLEEYKLKMRTELIVVDDAFTQSAELLSKLRAAHPRK